MQPGHYKVVFRSRYAQRSFYTIEKTFEINPGTNTNVGLFGR